MANKIKSEISKNIEYEYFDVDALHGTDVTSSTPGMAADAYEVGKLKTAIERYGGGGQPIAVSAANKFVNTDATYLYLGNEDGYDYGYIYVYLNGEWTKTSLYGKGQDAVSPTASVTQTEEGATIQITDENGTTEAKIENGKASDAQVETYVNAWLDEHPEATTTVEDGSISKAKLTDEVLDKIGLERDKVDKSIDLRSYATVKAAKWSNANITYPATGANCVELAFNMEDIREVIPNGLTFNNATELMLFGVNNTELYSNKFIITHDNTNLVVPSVYNPGSNGTSYHNFKNLLTANFPDCEKVCVYVFKRDISSPTDADIESIVADITAKVCDMTCRKAYSYGYRIGPTYGKSEEDATIFAFNEGINNVTVTGLNWPAPSAGVNPTFRVIGSDFGLIGSAQIKGSMQQLGSTYVHQDLPRGEDGYPVDCRKYIYTIPRPENGAYWNVYSDYVDENTVILENKSTEEIFDLSDEEKNVIKTMYPFLGEYKGLFSRTLNSGASYAIRQQNPNVTVTTMPYYDILENGTDGDWYIYHYFNDLKIKNTIATWGDIVYRKDETTYLALNNPFKWGNWKTVAESSYDIVIVGGGAGGIGAAYALRNSGLKVLLVDKMSSLGGTHTQAGLHNFITSPIGDWFKNLCIDAYNCGALRLTTWNTELGKLSGFENRWNASLAVNPKTKATMNLNINGNWLCKRYNDDLSNSGIDIRTRRKFLRHNDMNGKITSLVFLNEFTGSEEKVFAKYVIDCTGDIYVGRYNRALGTDFFLGSDPYSLYNESAAQDISEGNIYDINTPEIMYRYAGYGGGVRFDYNNFTNTDELADKDNDFPTMPGVTKGANSTYDSPWYIKVYDPEQRLSDLYNSSVFPGYYTTVSPDYHCGITKKMFVDNGEERTHEASEDYARAHYKISYKSDKNYFGGIYPLLAIREGYRMHCEYMTTQADCEDTITSANYIEKEIVALCSWYADIHQNSTVKTNIIQNTFKNGIPYRAMIPTSYTNLLVACRGYGASHIALSSMRLIKCMMSLGRAAGFAVKQCVENGIRDVRDVNVAQLQVDCGVGTLLAYLETNVYPDFETYGEMTLSTDSLTINEGETGTFTVVLQSAPSVDQSVSINISNDNVIQISPASLTFTPQNWDTPQTVTVTTLSGDYETNNEFAITLTSRKVNDQQVSISIVEA